MVAIQEQTFGFEMEFYGLTRREAALVIQSVVGGVVMPLGGPKWGVKAADGRMWKVVYDSSIRNPRGEQCEFVTPICKYDDIEIIQEIIRGFRSNGAGVNDSCGIHVHVGAELHTQKSLKNIVNIMYSKQDMLYRALKMHPARAERWAKKIDSSILDRFKNKMNNVNDIGMAWYGSDPAFHQTNMISRVIMV